jgi:hypothetical protein
MNTEVKQTGMEKLKTEPLIERIIFMCEALRQLEDVAAKQSSGLPSRSRKEADVKVRLKGKAEAYRDTSIFLRRLFGDDIRETIKARKEVDNEHNSL